MKVLSSAAKNVESKPKSLRMRSVWLGLRSTKTKNGQPRSTRNASNLTKTVRTGSSAPP